MRVHRVRRHRAGASGFGTSGICDDRRDASTFLTTFFCDASRFRSTCGSPAPRPRKSARSYCFSGRRRKTFGHAYPQTAFVADPQSVCLSRQRRRAENVVVCGGDGVGEKARAETVTVSLHDLPDAMLCRHLPSTKWSLADDTPVSISPDTNLTAAARPRRDAGHDP